MMTINQAYQTSLQWISTKFPELTSLARYSVTWIKGLGPSIKNTGYTIGAFAKERIGHSLGVASHLLKQHQWVLLGSALVGVAGTVYYLWNQRKRINPPGLTATLRAIPDRATLSLKALKQEQRPIDVMLTFCVDTSSSMNGKRINAVKRAVAQVLDHAKQPDFPRKL
jgi:hypothetical protein